MITMTPMMARTPADMKNWRGVDSICITERWVFEFDFSSVKIRPRGFSGDLNQAFIRIDRDNIDQFVRWYVTSDPHKPIKLEADDA